jgi:hypothetical protein
VRSECVRSLGEETYSFVTITPCLKDHTGYRSLKDHCTPCLKDHRVPVGSGARVYLSLVTFQLQPHPQMYIARFPNPSTHCLPIVRP